MTVALHTFVEPEIERTRIIFMISFLQIEMELPFLARNIDADAFRRIRNIILDDGGKIL